jgi:NAD(P)-dependent dehydrogenase (short-subunit alcohol dehydrogenase family)
MAKTIVITGASSGIGAAAARELSRQGHQVVVVGRSPERTAAVARSLGADHHVADFTRLADVRALAETLLAAYPRIDVLANNAGGAFGDPRTTPDGFETTFQVNHLAPFLLTSLLLEPLVASGATVLQTSSVAAGMVRSFDPTDLDLELDFSAKRAYCTAKLENVLFTMELHRRYHEQGLNAVAFHPGNVATGFATDTTDPVMHFVATNRLTRSLLIKPEKAATRLARFATTAPGPDWTPGLYYAKGRPKALRHATTDNARALWENSERMLAG